MAAERPRKNTGEYIYRLNTLDFALGIRAEEVNENFKLLKYWIEAERLRLGGWGIVEGFELSRDIPTLTIFVTEGTLINEKGEEIHVPGDQFGPIPISKRHIAETVTSDGTGRIKLMYPVYSNHFRHVIVYAPETSSEEFTEELSQEISLTEQDTGLSLNLRRDIVFIAENEIQLTNTWANKTFRIEYDYAADRFDAIFVKKDGAGYLHKEIPMGIISTSPSIQVVEDYMDEYYLIGFAYWHVGQEVDVEFFTQDRTLRKVYVDRNNILYLNGKPYQEKTVIYFTEPNPPTENDLWYDIETEILYIWRPDENGKYGWQPVNDLARGITAVYQFQENENPKDLQTLSFFAHPELFFMPGKHQVTVIIDQVVIMEDQYEELYYSKEEIEKLNAAKYAEQYKQLQKHLCGYGIKFKYPLERPSIIEIRVSHDLNTRRHDSDLFGTTTVFSAAGRYTVTNVNTKTYTVKSGSTVCNYEPDKEQLDVYKNGIRLACGIDYTEVLKNGSDTLCDRFKITGTLQLGDKIDYKLYRNVSTYANLKLIMDEYLDQLSALEQKVDNAISLNASVQEHLQEQIDALSDHMQDARNDIQTLQNTCVYKTAPIGKSLLDASIYGGVVRGKINLRLTTNASSLFLDDVKPTDYITVAYVASNTSSAILLSETAGDYSITNATNGSNLQLAGKWLGNSTAKVYVTGLKLGV